MSAFENITTSPNIHLSNLASVTRNFKLVGRRIATPVQSDTQAGAILKEDPGSLFEMMEAISAARATVGEISVTTSEDLFAILSYAIKGWCSETDVMAARRAGGNLAALRPKERTARKVANNMELLEEVLIARKLFTAANWGTQTAPASAKFDAASDPIKIITDAKEQVMGWEDSPGAKIKVLFGRTAWMGYRTNDKVRAAFQNAVGGAQAKEMPDSEAVRYAAAQLEVDEVLVGRARLKDAAGARVDIWTDNVLIAVVNESPEIDSGAAAHLLWWGDVMRRVYEQFTHDNDQFPDGATLIKIASSILPKIINQDGGFLLTDCMT